MDQFEKWFVLAFFVGWILMGTGVVLMLAFRKPDITLSHFLNGGPGEPVRGFLKAQLEMVRTSKAKIVYKLLFVGMAIMMVDILVMAGVAIASSRGAI